MVKITTFLYTLVDEETGELADIAAPDKSAARLWLGGDWIFSPTGVLSSLGPPRSQTGTASSRRRNQTPIWRLRT